MGFVAHVPIPSTTLFLTLTEAGQEEIFNLTSTYFQICEVPNVNVFFSLNANKKE